VKVEKHIKDGKMGEKKRRKKEKKRKAGSKSQWVKNITIRVQAVMISC
jgi:hypothetical protein